MERPDGQGLAVRVVLLGVADPGRHTRRGGTLSKGMIHMLVKLKLPEDSP